MKQIRNSNLELYRIMVMLLIVAHHYVVNSGLMEKMQDSPLSSQSIFFYLFGAWGKTGINCFVLITGYFMCKSQITSKKFFKLLFEVLFYNIVLYSIFILFGYEEFSIGTLENLIPARNIETDFTSCFLIFYLCIPFLNILIHNLDKKKHLLLICLSLFIYT
ncbi:acyltransferase family protein, partial [Bacteroides caecigallinarum]|uniref:acyltransferase family protein n=1 Tax=Bacteroides caecigallinarum TaxID=1411144 RepID=UPI00397CC6B0